MLYVVSRKVPSFPARADRILQTSGVPEVALEIAQEKSNRNRQGSYGVYAIEDGGRLVRGVTYVAGQLVAMGQQGVSPYCWDWSSDWPS